MKNKFTLWVLIFLVFISTPVSYGESGDGSGGGGAFKFVESIPENSAKGVRPDEEVKLLFNKNVVNFSVKDNNAKCFSIKDADNKEVPIEVIFADDQIDRDKRREIILRPKEPFDQNTAYTVHISPNLKAKNGDNLGKDVSISFTTVSSGDKQSPSSGDEPVGNGASGDVDTAPDGRPGGAPSDGRDEDTDSITDSEGEMDIGEEDMDLDGTDDAANEQKETGSLLKKYMWVIISGVVLVLVIVFRKRL